MYLPTSSCGCIGLWSDADTECVVFYAGQAEDKPAPAAKQDTIPDDELESELEAGGIVSKEPVPVSNPYEALEGAAETVGAEASE